MINDDLKRSLFNKILKSEEFINSPKNQKLLTYLFDVSIRNEIPREFDIATEVFKRSGDFDPAGDTIVRVSMHNLRSKLKKYYETEGKKEKIQIVIDKGHYDLKFVDRSKTKSSDQQYGIFSVKNIIIAILFLTTIFSIYKLISYRSLIDHEALKLRSTALWSDIANSPRKKLFVLGDEFFFIQYEETDQSVVRKHYINTIEEFDEFVAQQTDSLFRRKTPYSFFPKMPVWSLGPIIRILKPYTKYDFHESSKLQSSDLLTNDIIFLGAFRSLYLFKDIIKDISFKYHWGENLSNLMITNKDSTITLSFEGGPDRKHTDYCYLKKFPGPSNNTIIMLFSSFESGMAGVVEIVTDYEKLKELERTMSDTLGFTPRYYSILFQTIGHSRTAIKTIPIQFEPFDQDQSLW